MRTHPLLPVSRLLAVLVLALSSAAGTALLGVPRTAEAASPSFTSISPSQGSTGGGTAVTITGTNFEAGMSVYIGSSPATNVVVVNSTTLTATTASGSQGSANVLLVNPGGEAASANAVYFFTQNAAALSVTTVSPSEGGAGVLTTITGNGFQAGATVLFGGIASNSVTWLATTTLFVRTPSGPSGLVGVVVTNPDGSSASLPNAYNYGGSSSGFSVASVTPSSGATSGGTTVTITGNGFISGSTVLFGSALATNVNVISTGQLTAVTPAGVAGTVPVTVSTGTGLAGTLNAAYTYTTNTTPTQTNALTVAGVTPSVGTSAGGTVVTVTGTGFLAGATVLFGLLPATNVTVVSSTQLTATTPANSVATGPVAVTVVNAGGVSGTLSSAFTYGAAASGPLSIGSLSPTSGTLNGGTTVTVNGTGLTGVTSVQFGGVNGSGVSVVNDTKLTVVTPAHAVGPVAVTVVSSNGSSTTLPNGYVFSAAPAATLTAVSPATGTTSGGSSVTLSGSGFATGMTVTFGGTLGTNVSVVSATQATVTVPSRSTTGTVDVTITLPSGEIASLPTGFTYQAAGTASQPLPSSGFGLFVFSGGTNAQLTTASGCTTTSAAFWATDAAGSFVVYVPNTSIGAVNAAWNALFPAGVPANTALIGKCA